MTIMNQSQQLFERAKKTIPGGVNSPVRAFRSVGGTPFFTKKLKAVISPLQMIRNYWIMFAHGGQRYMDTTTHLFVKQLLKL